MIEILTEFFDSKTPTSPECSLELVVRPKKVFNSSFPFYSNNYNSGSGGGYSSKYIGSGACLNHDHKTQYTFVLQSLTLWKEIMTNLPRLWYLADGDMTNELYRLELGSQYFVVIAPSFILNIKSGLYVYVVTHDRLADTGQGYQRLQSCPRVARAMSNILHRVQNRCGPWVGLSVVHLGDRDVPNGKLIKIIMFMVWGPP